jgi:hypothetical protein
MLCVCARARETIVETEIDEVPTHDDDDDGWCCRQKKSVTEERARTQRRAPRARVFSIISLTCYVAHVLSNAAC